MMVIELGNFPAFVLIFFDFFVVAAFYVLAINYFIRHRNSQKNFERDMDQNSTGPRRDLGV